MNIEQLEKVWGEALQGILGNTFDNQQLFILAKQTRDSIRRVEIFQTYLSRARNAVGKGLSYYDTSNPFVLAQRSDLTLEERVWIIYLATYFGKSSRSGWTLFHRAAFDKNHSLIRYEQIKMDIEKYFDYLSSFDFFEGCTFSNHRKYTAKKLEGKKGIFRSMRFVIENIGEYTPKDAIGFDEMYKRAKRIPGFDRLGGFDFASFMAKCNLQTEEPESMYAANSTGPLKALGLMLRLTGNKDDRQSRIQLSEDLMEWFDSQSLFMMTGQVLEDAICNWQKDTKDYVRFSG